MSLDKEGGEPEADENKPLTMATKFLWPINIDIQREDGFIDSMLEEPIRKYYYYKRI
jgi:hypothetical protein